MEIEDGNEIILFFVGGTAILLLLALSIILLSIVHGKRVYKKQVQIQELELKHQRELLEHYMTATEEERKRLASDLHDDVGTRLSTFKLMLSGQAGVFGDDELRKEVDEIIQNVREISHDIMPSAIELFGLDVSVKQLVASFNRNGQTNFECHIEHTYPLEIRESLALYRVVQELMNNTLKHSGASQAMIRSGGSDTAMQLTYTDNGKGIGEMYSGGIGIRSIENRIKMIGARAQWLNTNEGGMSIQIFLPAPRE